MMRGLCKPLLIAMLAAGTLTADASAQLHGTREGERRERVPGIKPGSLEDTLIGAIEQSHRLTEWQSKDAVVSLSIELIVHPDREGEGEGDDDDDSPTEPQTQRIRALFATEGDGFRIDVGGEPAFGHDGEVAWQTPRADDLGDAAAHIRMLGVVPALPYRLRDDRNIFRSGPMRMVNDYRFYAASLEWLDSDDWSVVLVDPQTDLIQIVAYFVRLTEDDEPGFSQAYALVAGQYETAENIPVARNWEIWRWSRPRGIVGDEPVGSVRVKDVQFVDRANDAFAKPNDDEQ